MRDELVKFERYQKQFHFLIDNDIETTEQLINFKKNTKKIYQIWYFNEAGYMVKTI